MTDWVSQGLTTLIASAAGAFAGAWGMQRLDEHRQRQQRREKEIHAARRVAAACEDLRSEVESLHRRDHTGDPAWPRLARGLQRRLLADDVRLLRTSDLVESCPYVEHQKQMEEAYRKAKEAFELWCSEAEDGSPSNAGFSAVLGHLHKLAQSFRAYAAWLEWKWPQLYEPRESDLAKHRADMRPVGRKIASSLGDRLSQWGKVHPAPASRSPEHPDDDARGL